MRMEFRRLVGTVIFETTWPKEEEPITDLNEQAKEAFESFYEGNEHCFWPKKEFAANAPEEVRIINECGIVVAKYDIHNFAADTKRSLALPKMPKVPKKRRKRITAQGEMLLPIIGKTEKETATDVARPVARRKKTG